MRATWIRWRVATWIEGIADRWWRTVGRGRGSTAGMGHCDNLAGRAEIWKASQRPFLIPEKRGKMR